MPAGPGRRTRGSAGGPRALSLWPPRVWGLQGPRQPWLCSGVCSPLLRPGPARSARSGPGGQHRGPSCQAAGGSGSSGKAASPPMQPQLRAGRGGPAAQSRLHAGLTWQVLQALMPVSLPPGSATAPNPPQIPPNNPSHMCPRYGLSHFHLVSAHSSRLLSSRSACADGQCGKHLPETRFRSSKCKFPPTSRSHSDSDVRSGVQPGHGRCKSSPGCSKLPARWWVCWGSPELAGAGQGPGRSPA